MGKKKSNQQSQQLQRVAEMEDAIADNNTVNRNTSRQIDDKVNNIHSIFPDWAKVDIRRALEENEYDEDRVINNHLTGADAWLEVKKKESKETTISRPKTRRVPSGIQSSVGDRGDRGSQRGGMGRGAPGAGRSKLQRTDRTRNDVETAATVKTFITETPITTTIGDESNDGTTNVRTFRSYSEAAAVLATPEPVVTETVITKEKPKKKRLQQQQQVQQQQQLTSTITQQQQQPTLQYIQPEHRNTSTIIPPPSAATVSSVSPSSPPSVRSTQQQQQPLSTPSSYTTTTITSTEKVLSPSSQDRKTDTSVIMPNVDFNAVNVQFGSLGINNDVNNVHHGVTVVDQTRTENKESSSLPSAPTLGTQEAQQQESSDYAYTSQNSAWGSTNEDQYHASEQYEESSTNTTDQSSASSATIGGQFQQTPYQQHPHQQPTMYGFQQPQQPVRGGDKGAQRTSPNPNLPYGKQQQQQQGYPSPYGAMPTIHGSQQYPTYPSYYPYMMPNQFQYPNYHQMPNAKFPQQFYGKPNPYAYAVPGTTQTGQPGASSDDSQLDYKNAPQQQQQFDTSNLGQQPYFYGMPHQPQQQQQPGAEGKNLKGKDNRTQGGEQPIMDPSQQQPQFAYQGYPGMYNNYSYMFQPPFAHQQQYAPQPTTSAQQGGQANKSGRDQQQQSSLTSTWQ